MLRLIKNYSERFNDYLTGYMKDYNRKYVKSDNNSIEVNTTTRNQFPKSQSPVSAKKGNFRPLF